MEETCEVGINVDENEVFKPQVIYGENMKCEVWLVFESVNIEATSKQWNRHFQPDVEEQQLEELWRHFDKNGVRLSKHDLKKTDRPS